MQFATDKGELPTESDIRHWIEAVFHYLDEADSRRAELTVRIVDDPESRELNGRYRGKDKPTNVLSFPAGDDFALPEGALRPLGDLVLCAPLVMREAGEQDKRAANHWAHLLIHGTLHLLGYDHQQEPEAAAMEALEIAILAAHGLPDPYVEREPG